ncbi:zeta toxin family protein [Methylobacterium sp. E-045]|uniref:zeta toxin family protein n=1 Tax=Methylobacterium sp. E-045 TaxID=2836575 RepID=UPI001FB95B18|nr:zeta toxin family protein [Methylobacterium sp. E-045]MCJ2129177.1 zeta toxin family protein [Methylobacterium sp. E-045]
MSIPEREVANLGEPKPREEFGPWNPGLESSLPRAFLALETIFRSDHVETTLADARELMDVSGLPLTQLVRFRARRLVVHEVLIRVMADLSVPVGRTYGDLGVNFRAMVGTILRDGVASHEGEISGLLDRVRNEAVHILERELSVMLMPRSAEEPVKTWRSSWRFIHGSSEPERRRREAGTPEQAALLHLDAWQARCTASAIPVEAAACAALRHVVTSIISRRGFLIRDRALLSSLACTLVSNQYGSTRIGQLIEPWVRDVVASQGYYVLAAQDRPVVMNVKGASASGKSTIRPYQRALAGRLGLDGSDFAVITPDVWRKFLLDYDSLGPAQRYAGTLTGREVEIIDRKLDRHMAVKAAEGRISHLLIDRFRFDSFTVDPGAESGSQLLTRFGHCVYMQFMITPPEATVERAWKRGEQFGRYKAVEDLLAHNVEAYTGMPRLFFTWALRTDKQVHFEFLDNSVPEGERPRTIAFGINGGMTILDLKFIFDIDRYRKIDVTARSPDEVYAAAGSMESSQNLSFLRDCVRRMTTIRFADHGTGRVYARLERARLTHLAADVVLCAVENPDLHAALSVMGVTDQTPAFEGPGERLRPQDTHTLGRWGDAAPF